MELKYFVKNLPNKVIPLRCNKKIVFNDLYESLNKYKSHINDNTEWDKIKKLGNPYELVHVTNKSNQNNSIATYNPVSRSYFKLWELIQDYQILHSSNKAVIANLAEGPGGFMEAIINYRKDIDDRLYGITLDSINRYIPGWNKILEKYSDKINITYGNLYLKEDIMKYVNNFSKKADLITADGGFDYSTDFNNQEQQSYHIIFAELVCALMIQKQGGTYICKIFDIFTEFTIKMIYIMYCLYDKVYIVKPLTSRPANSEKYIVALGFRGINNDLLESLKDILFNWSDEINNIGGFDVPQDFVNKIYKYNSEYIQNQIYYLNSIIDLIQNKPTKLIYNTIIRKQKESAIEWCNKYNMIINKNSKYMLY